MYSIRNIIERNLIFNDIKLVYVIMLLHYITFLHYYIVFSVYLNKYLISTPVKTYNGC